MGARMFVWPHYVLEVDGKRATLPRVAGAAVARMFRSPGHFISSDEMIEAVYFDDPDGGPLWALNSITVSLCRAKETLASVGTAIQGWQKTGGCRLLFMWHSPEHPCHDLDLAPVGHHGPYRYLASRDTDPCPYDVAGLTGLRTAPIKTSKFRALDRSLF